MTRLRHELPDDQWPAIDQELWAQAFTNAGPFEQVGAACHWAKPTATQVKHGYALWLGHLRRTGNLDPAQPPCERATKATLIGYISALQSRIAPVSVCSRLRDLSEALRVMQPKGDRGLVTRALLSLERSAKPSRNLRARLVAPSEIYEAGFRLMDRIAAKAGPISTRTAQTYGDGLRLALLAAKPVRLRNLASTKIGTHLAKVGSGYRWRFKASETKTRETIDVELPVRLTAYIDRWIADYRPVFPGADKTDALWLSSKGGPMSQAGVYDRVCLATKRELGVRVNPHAFRHIVATSIAIVMPEDVRMTPFLLDHRSERTVAEHYDLANSVAASARYLKQLELRRQRALGRDRNR